jgi:hypothetical protein
LEASDCLADESLLNKFSPPFLLVSPLLGGIGGLMSFTKLIAVVVDQFLRDFEWTFFFVDVKSKDD